MTGDMLVALMLTFFVCEQAVSSDKMEAKNYDHQIDLPTTRPLVIGHRGSCGTYPEHTVIAYQQAVEDGADMIECDVTVTKDLKLICIHSPALSVATNINDHPEFADRQRTLSFLGTNQTDIFSFDLTLAEIKQLRVRQYYSMRDLSFDWEYEIATLEEYINVGKSGKIGLYIETKKSDDIHEYVFKNIDKTFESLLVEVLHEHGYKDATDPCFLQSFQESSLNRLRNLTNLPLVLLIDYWNEQEAAAYENQKDKIYGIGIWKDNIIHIGTDNRINVTLDKLELAHADGLKVHAYTYRNEYTYLAYDYRQDPVNEYEMFYKLGLDGYFTDFPHTLVRYFDDIYTEEDQDASGAAILAIKQFQIICLCFAVVTMFLIMV